eukprot:3650522-Rhodomonas_salina.1
MGLSAAEMGHSTPLKEGESVCRYHPRCSVQYWRRAPLSPYVVSSTDVDHIYAVSSTDAGYAATRLERLLGSLTPDASPKKKPSSSSSALNATTTRRSICMWRFIAVREHSNRFQRRMFLSDKKPM